jgi:hypothetical protein
MHHENISKTKVIIEAMKGELWEGLEDGARRDIIRKLHHKISAELVVNATGESSLLGFQIDINNNPRHIAALCEAHGIDTLDDRYALLCGSGGSIRLGLLSALLRIADLLDETRARANRVKAKALLLNIESQVHWWRHYYVESLIWDIKQLSVTLCFDFPAARRTEYSQIVPFIHMPILHDEIARHRSTLAPMQLNWLISFCSG